MLGVVYHKGNETLIFSSGKGCIEPEGYFDKYTIQKDLLYIHSTIFTNKYYHNHVNKQFSFFLITTPDKNNVVHHTNNLYSCFKLLQCYLATEKLVRSQII